MTSSDAESVRLFRLLRTTHIEARSVFWPLLSPMDSNNFRSLCISEDLEPVIKSLSVIVGTRKRSSVKTGTNASEFV